MFVIPEDSFSPDDVPEGIQYIKGQLETGHETGYRHWQLIIVFKKKQSLESAKRILGGDWHGELTRSKAADEYCWKEDTRIDGTQFEYGTKLVRRNEAKDWERIWQQAQEGQIEQIPADIRVCHYRSLRTITADFGRPVALVRSVYVYYGPPGSGKSRRAWDEAGFDAYPKDPRTKFWDGYQGEENVVIDEFRGGVDIAHVLRWFDRYPVRVEIKGAGSVLRARRIWITSNLHPSEWYPMLDSASYRALERRLIIEEIK